MSDAKPDIQEIFCKALDQESPAELRDFLDTACRGDTQLRAEVEKLLESHQTAGDFLNGYTRTNLCADIDGVEGATAGSRTTPHVDDIPLDFLEPPQLSGSLGRLGQYDILEAVGRGGMGIVLKAREQKLNRVVAVKVLAPELASNPTARKRFAREAQAAAAVSHDHVVTIYAVEDGDQDHSTLNAQHSTLPYLVMEFIDGQSLQQKIDREGALELKEILRIGRQIAAGLAAAHEQGLIHRDVKPSNILLQNGVQRVQITDFGLARAVDDVGMTRTGEVTGTPQYMSPEQAQGQPVDARSDLFSLGSVLYAMCTGRSPFRADSSVASLRRVCDETPRPIQQINADIPEWLTAIIDRLLEKNADDRFQTANEVSELLGKHLAHLQDPRSTPFPGMVRPLKYRPASRATSRRLQWLVAGLILLALTTMFGVTEATGVTNLSTMIVRIATGKGTLEIQTNDPGLQITVSGDGQTVTIRGGGVEQLTLPLGNYRVAAVKDGEPVKQELATITRNGTTVVRMILDPEQPMILDPEGPVETPPVTILPHPIAGLPPRMAFDILTSDEYEWTPPEKLGPQINSVEGAESDPCVSADGLTLLFTSKRDTGTDYDLWQSTRASVDDPWSEAARLAINSATADGLASMSGDGLTMIFLSARTGGQGSWDLWQSTRTSSEDDWETPVNLGAQINSSKQEFYPQLSNDGLRLIFTRLEERTPPEICVTTRESVHDEWLPAELLRGHHAGPAQLFDSDWTLLGSEGEGGPFVARWNPSREDWDDGFRSLLALNNGQNFAKPFFNLATNTLYFEYGPGGLEHRDLWISGRVPRDELAEVPRLTPYQWPADAPPAAIAPFDSRQAAEHQQAWADWLGADVEEEIVLGQDDDGEDVTLTMVLIPPGEFLMGSTDEEQMKLIAEAQAIPSTQAEEVTRIRLEGPQHWVRITRPFRLSQREVTLGQFRRFAEANPTYKTDAERDGKGGWGLSDGAWTQDPGFLWNSDIGFPQSDDHPVVNTSWNDATAFCEWLSEQSGSTFALPTEAQWEYACRAGTSTCWCCVDREYELRQFAWCNDSSTHPGGQHPPNPYRLFDIHGNVVEWCADWFAANYYYDAPLNDPNGPSSGTQHMVRGGSWGQNAAQCRSAYRLWYPPDARSFVIGFRVAAPLPEDVPVVHPPPSPSG